MSTLSIYFGGYEQLVHPHGSFASYPLPEGSPIRRLSEPTLESIANKIPDRISIGGPGCTTPQADDIISDQFKWNEAQLINQWENNISQAIKIIKSKPNASSTAMTLDVVERLAKSGISLGWMARNYKFDFSSTLVNERTDSATPTEVNLIGYSRGATSCHMLANAMLGDSELSGIPVNIFAIDPVIAITSSRPSDNQVKLGDNVKEYVAFCARDERSSNYACVIPTTNESTQLHIYPMAGRHPTLGGNPADDGDRGSNKFPEPCDIVTYCASACLARWNQWRATLKGMIDESLLPEKLAKIKADYNNYVVMRNTTYSTSVDIRGEREIFMGGEPTNFTSAQGNRFTPNQGLAKGHIEDMSYFNDIT
ncbi:hypothetical protein [Pseudomonas fluorescens]|uniref:hypothetical protein n=1 Tax=Pseudomonas TaxID=286 RepID=UPI003CFFC98D